MSVGHILLRTVLDSSAKSGMSLFVSYRLTERQADILKRRDDFAILLNKHSVFKGVGGLSLV